MKDHISNLKTLAQTLPNLAENDFDMSAYRTPYNEGGEVRYKHCLLGWAVIKLCPPSDQLLQTLFETRNINEKQALSELFGIDSPLDRNWLFSQDWADTIYDTREHACIRIEMYLQGYRMQGPFVSSEAIRRIENPEYKILEPWEN